MEKQMINAALLDILVCPICKGKLLYRKEASELVCKVDRMAYPIENEIPIMLESRSRELNTDEKY